MGFKRKNVGLIVLALLLTSICYAGFETEKLDITTTSTPPVSDTDTARIYFNGATDDTLKLSENGGAYSDILTTSSGSALFLKLDQTTPQDIINGQPDFLAGLRAGSTNQFSIDVSGNVSTTGYGELDAGILSVGETTGFTIPSGTGTRLMWIPNKGAFRAGRAINDDWDISNIGLCSFATGELSKASGDFSVALGDVAIATGNKSFATSYATASGFNSVAMNSGAVASGYSSMAFGLGAVASAIGSIAIGGGGSMSGATASGEYSIAIGKLFTNSTDNSFAVGFNGIDMLITEGSANFQDTNILTTGTLGAGATTIDTNSTSALLVEQNGVKDNVLVVDTTNGIVKVGNGAFNGTIPFGVFGTNYTTYAGGYPMNMELLDNRAWAKDVGGGIIFGGADGTFTNRWFAGFHGGKENAISGDYSGYLSFHTRVNGGAVTEKWRIDSGGQLLAGVDGTGAYNILTAGTLGAGAITGTSLTASGLTPSLGVYTTTGGLLTTAVPTSGILGYWSRTGTILVPANSGDLITLNNNSTTGLLVEQTGVKSNVLTVDTTNGRVGINMAPAQALDVTGNIKNTGTVAFNNTAINSNIGIASTLTTTGSNLSNRGFDGGINLTRNSSNISSLVGINFTSSWNVTLGASTGRTLASWIGGSGNLTFGLDAAETKNWSITQGYGFKTATTITGSTSGGGTATLADYKHFYAPNPVLSNVNSLITNLYAFYDEGQTSGTTLNYGFYGKSTNNLLEDNCMWLFGTGGDASIKYDGTNMLINPDLVGTGYLNIQGQTLVDDKIMFTQIDGNEYIDSLNDGYMDYGATIRHRFNAPIQLEDDNTYFDNNSGDIDIYTTSQKTIELQTAVYEDLQFPVSSSKVPASHAPAWETFTTNTSEYSFAVDDYIDTPAAEVPHQWVEGTAGDAHLHITLKAANGTGSNRYAKFSLQFAVADHTATSRDDWTEPAALTGELTIPTGSAALQEFYLDMGDLTFTNYKIGSQIKVRIKRIAATGGTEYSGSIFITQCGVHMQRNTLGSRQETIK